LNLAEAFVLIYSAGNLWYLRVKKVNILKNLFGHLFFLPSFLTGAMLCLGSCSPNSSSDFQQEGEAWSRSLIKALKKIENREQLAEAEPYLKKQFEALIDLIIASHEFQHSHFDLPQEVALNESSVEKTLEEELRRIYAFEGGREVVERAQQEALVRLDGYKRSLIKKNEKLNTRK
jgi:hypothetical protein